VDDEDVVDVEDGAVPGSVDVPTDVGARNDVPSAGSVPPGVVVPVALVVRGAAVQAAIRKKPHTSSAGGPVRTGRDTSAL